MTILVVRNTTKFKRLTTLVNSSNDQYLLSIDLFPWLQTNNSNLAGKSQVREDQKRSGITGSRSVVQDIKAKPAK